MHKTKRFLLTDLEKNLRQCSVDPEADIRFAKFVGWQISLPTMEQYEKSPSIVFSVVPRSITKRRLRVLNGMVKTGLVKARWVGASKKILGVTRIRVYTLSSAKED